MGQVVAGLGVENHKIAPGFHHRRQIIQSDVGTGVSIVEPPVGVLLDNDRLFLVSGRVLAGAAGSDLLSMRCAIA